MTEILKTNPFVRIDGDFNLVNVVATERFDVVDLRLVPFFDYASTWRSRSDARDRLCSLLGVPEEEGDEMIDEFTDEDMLIHPGSTYDALAEEARAWIGDGWQAELDYYLAVTDIMQDHSSSPGGQWIKRAWEGEEVPPVYKTYESAESVPLADPSSFEIVDEDWDSLFPPSADPSDDDLTRRELSALLYLTFGEIDKKAIPRVAEFLKKTSPSGGARHPTEAYVAVRDVEDVPPGLYHYSVKEHELERVSDAGVQDLAPYVPSVDDDDVKVVLLCGSMVERNMMKYKLPRSYTVVVQDVGHLLETFRLLSTGMDHTCHPAFDVDPSIHEELGFSYYEEPILCGATIR